MRSTSPGPSTFLRSFPYEIPPQSTWFLRTTSISASWLALAGYTLFSVLVSPTDQLRWSPDALAVLGGIFLAGGYIGGMIAFYFARTLAFRLDSVVLPLLLSSVGGLFEITINWALHVEVQSSRAYVYAPLAVACISTVVCTGGALYLNTQRKIRSAVEESRRRHMELTGQPLSSWDVSGTPATAGTPFLEPGDGRHTPQYPDGHADNTSHKPPRPYNIRNMPMPPPLRHMSSTELRPIEMNIPEDEAQRRQLLRLLIAQERASSDSTDANLATTSAGNGPQPGSGTSSTYRIEWPGGLVDDAGQLSPSFPPPPLSQAQAAAHHRRHSSEITNKWTLGNLLGGRKKQAPQQAPLSAQAIREQQREERERRRREIERSSLSEQGMGGVGGAGGGGARGSPRQSQGLLSERTAYGGGGEA